MVLQLMQVSITTCCSRSRPSSRSTLTPTRTTRTDLTSPSRKAMSVWALRSLPQATKIDRRLPVPLKSQIMQGRAKIAHSRIASLLINHSLLAKRSTRSSVRMILTLPSSNQRLAWRHSKKISVLVILQVNQPNNPNNRLRTKIKTPIR